MKNLTPATEVINIVKKYFEDKLGELKIGMAQECFCLHNLNCKVRNLSPIIVPDIAKQQLQIHIASRLAPMWYPNQLVYQFSHELWHAYEFAQHGIDFPWNNFEAEMEPYAYAASLCLLSKNLIPSSMLPSEAQIQYFEHLEAEGPERDIYAPGGKIAHDIDYDLKKLYNLYNKNVVPMLLDTRS